MKLVNIGRWIEVNEVRLKPESQHDLESRFFSPASFSITQLQYLQHLLMATSMAESFDLSLGLEGTHVLVTGGNGLIGRVVVKAFLAAGATVEASTAHY